MSNPLFDAMDELTYTLDGVHGTFRHVLHRHLSGYIESRLTHVPSAAGKRSKAYQTVKAKLRDDWESDLTQDIDGYCAIALALGIDVDKVCAK